jgi:glycerol-3-phosphate dehydrogenase
MDSPERLSLEVLSDALATGNARAINYCEATGTKDGSIVVKDHVNGETFNFKADVVINASGPWTDLTNGTLGVATAYMGGTKGSHIVVDNPELLLACNGNEIFFENADGRIVLMYPLLDRVLIGSSDIRVDIAEPVSVTEEEIDYFFELVSQVFPKISVTRDQIVYRYTGVRPLPAAGDLAPGFVSRDYRIEKTLASAENGFSLLSLIGGKWTTFRALGEHLANETLSLLGKNRLVSTASMPIGGGKGFPQSEAEISTWLAVHAKEIDSDRALVLLHRYGTKAEHLLRAIQESGETRLNNKPEYSDLEIRHLVDSESVVHLADVLFRRTTIGFRGDLDLDIVREIGQIVATELGWSKSKLDGEIDSSVQEGQVGSK